MIRALLVGSQVNWKSKLDAILAEHDIRVDWWWESKSDLGAIPSACDLVLISTDKNSHTLSIPAADRARLAGVKLIHFMHRRAKLVPLLSKCGFPALHAPAPAPTPATLDEVSVNTSVNTKPTPPVSFPHSLLHGAKYHALRGTVERGRYMDMLRLLAADPLTPASAISVKMNITPAMVEHVVAAARQTLGIAGGRVSDGPRYEAACKALDIPASTLREPVRALEKPAVDPARTTLVRSPALTTAETPGEIPPYTGRDVCRARTLLRENQATFATRLRIGQPALCRLETGNRPLSTDLRRALHAILRDMPAGGFPPAPPTTVAGASTITTDMLADSLASPGPGSTITADEPGNGLGTGKQPALQSKIPPGQVPPSRPLTTVSRGNLSSTDLPDVASALALLREAMRAEHIVTLVVNASEHDEEIPRQVVAAGTSAVRRRVIVSDTLEA